MAVNEAADRLGHRTAVGILSWCGGSLLAAVGVLLLMKPGLIDLDVYRVGGQKLVEGVPLYSGQMGGTWLPFTYTPFAAVLFVPLAVVPGPVASLIVVWAAIGALFRSTWLIVGATRSSAGDRRRTSLVAVWAVVTALALIAEPTTGTLDFGQVNTILLWLVVEDVLGSGRTARRSGGILTGLAAGIKLTPGIFLLMYLAVGAFRRFAIGVGALIATMAIGALVQFDQAREFWTAVLWQDSRVGGVAYVSNQSLNGLLWRLLGPGGNRWLWLSASALVVVAAMWASRRAWTTQKLLALSATALAMLLVSPISWSHHWVWSVPALVLLYSWWDRGIGARLVLGSGLVILLSHALFLVPNGNDLEYGHSLAESLVANSYVLWGIAALAYLVACSARMRDDPASLPSSAISQGRDEPS
ncbi:MAG: glycosyltransferase 87 family protein [Candidatus Nanopelagicales bacterium]|nr:glycosyltransferase 87 family protein [Candidatus Nanopelagicales bacterium]